MYAIVADGGENGGAATLYTIDTSSFEATEVGSTGVTTNYVSSSTFAPDGTLYWAENNAGKLYTVDTATGEATAVYGGTIGGSGLSLNAMMIPSDTATTAMSISLSTAKVLSLWMAKRSAGGRRLRQGMTFR